MLRTARPQAVTVIGTLQLVFAGLGLLGLAWSVLQLAMVYVMRTAFTISPPMGVATPFKFVFNSFSDPRYLTWAGVGFALQGLGVLWKLATGFGLLAMKRWARRATMAYAAYVLIVAAIGLVGFSVITGKEVSSFATTPNAPMIVDMGHHIFASSWSFMGMIGGCGSFIYPIVLLYFMTRLDVRMAFATQPAVIEELL